MKKILISLAAVFMLSAVPQQADAQFFKKLGKALSKAGKVVGEVAGAAGTLTGGKTAGVLNGVADVAGQVSSTASAFTGEDSSTEQYSDNSMTQNYTNQGYTQGGGIRIVTGHPDLKVQVTRCEASGRTVVLDMFLINTGTSDVDDFRLYWDSQIMDTEGNTYEPVFKVGNMETYQQNVDRISLVPGVKRKVSVKIDKVAESAEGFARILIGCTSNSYGLNGEQKIQIRNVPISRD